MNLIKDKEMKGCYIVFMKHSVYSERTKQMEQILNSQMLAEGLDLVILLHTRY